MHQWPSPLFIKKIKDRIPYMVVTDELILLMAITANIKKIIFIRMGRVIR